MSGSPDVSLPAGFEVGHWTNAEARTGCTVVLAPPAARGGVDVCGGGPGTRETDILSPTANADQVAAVMLAGGSAYGLAAADGAARWLEERGRGYPTPGGLVPIVPAAIVYDLSRGRSDVRPGPDEGRAACEAANGGVPRRGRVGAGAGVAAGKALGLDSATDTGAGYSALTLPGGQTVAAVAIANPVGDIVGDDGSLLAAPRSHDGELVRTADLMLGETPLSAALPQVRESTTLVCVCTDAGLDKTECAVVARMATAGVARAVSPVFSPFDGDVVFCVSSGEPAADRALVLATGIAAASVTAAAIRDAALSARP